MCLGLPVATEFPSPSYGLCRGGGSLSFLGAMAHPGASGYIQAPQCDGGRTMEVVLKTWGDRQLRSFLQHTAGGVMLLVVN